MTGVGFYLTQGSRIFLNSWKNRFFPKKYSGNAKEICDQIVKECWNGRFFQTSVGNFPQFWTRDFGWCCKSLLSLGHKPEVHQTLRYALNRFMEAKDITTTVTPGGKAFDFPCMSIDSLPYLIHSIKISGFPYYSYKKFLNLQIKKFFNEVVDPVTGLVNPEKHFSSMKDFSIRKSSCYDNVMVGLLAKDLGVMKLNNPFAKYDYQELIERHFWNGKYFYDDLSKKEYVAGDANLFPFVMGVIRDKSKLFSVLKTLHKEGLDYPFPLKYTLSRKDVKFVSQEFFLRDYESNSIWTHMGPLYIKLIKEVSPSLAKEYKEKYGALVEEHGNYLEVFSNKGKPFGTPFYYCDRGMLWAANYLTL
ncbi:hypothetical protein HOC13_00220 [Candidatus Woesearchaeota archaeon]|jgi:hypothetical protein|nr:hypothetical protein [Candidatus Woesearchaeota archaeon]